METKAIPGTATSAVGLALADKQINSLFQRHLPDTPHIFFVESRTPYRLTFPHENLHTPFEKSEVLKLQYMTLISNGDRGVGASKGASDWEDEVYGKSPLSAAGQSSTSTPNAVRDSKKPSQKISLGDYKSFKQTGVKPSPRPYTATPEQRAKPDGDYKPGHSRNTSAISAVTPMGRGPSSEGVDHRQTSTVNTIRPEKASAKENERLAVPRNVQSNSKKAENPRPTANGQLPRDSIQSKDSNKDQRTSSKPDLLHAVKPPIKHPLPPRPRSPPRSNPEHKQQKRPLESINGSHPEKRVKIDSGELRTPSGSQKPTPRKPESATAETILSASKPQKSASQPTTSHQSPQSKKAVSSTKVTDSKSQSTKTSTPRSDKPLDLPPLLSPLPADLDGPELQSSGFAAIKKSDSGKATPPKTSTSKRALPADTIVVKQPTVRKEMAHSSPLTTPVNSTPPFVLPRLLSPDLPDIVEAELLRLQQKSATLNTVEARHEKARLPDAPGVARKTPRPKIGHPPKKSHAESSSKNVEKEEEKSLVVKIPYKKRQTIHVQRILMLTQKPRGQLEKLEAGEKLAREGSTSAAPLPKVDSDSEPDMPLAKSRSTKTPATASTSTSKKRPSDISDRNEPAPKRPKGPENLDVTKASRPVTPAFKSPALSGPSAVKEKSLLATPKKGDAMKSVTMRKVDSNDGQARTPQTAATSTPASAEKPRINGDQRPNPEWEKVKTEEAKFYPLGTMLKRKMDSVISPKNTNPVSESERKGAFCTGLESLMAYMVAFHARDRIAQLRSVSCTPDHWEDFLKLWVFLEHAIRSVPELHALCDQLGAVVREQLNKSYVEQLRKDGGKENLVKELSDNSRARDVLWAQAHRGERILRELGVKGTMLGPWSSVADAVTMAVSILGTYKTKEGLEWSLDPAFRGSK